MKVAEERCENCLFGADRIVDGERVREILEDCRAADTHFVCHKFGIGEMDGLKGTDVCCRGFYDTQPPSQMIRIAERLGVIEFIPLPKGGPKYTPARLEK